MLFPLIMSKGSNARARQAVDALERKGALLVFPLANRKQPASLWSEFYPRSAMRWEWDESGDDRVARLWHLREELSRSREVVYAKWFRGRATFFSRPVFRAMLRLLNADLRAPRDLGREAHRLYGVLELDSPLSTKALKKATDLTGRINEPAYARGLKELWNRLLIVGFGEVDEGAFPSLAIGSTRLIFEDLWHEASTLDPVSCRKLLVKTLGEDNLFYRQLLKLERRPKSAPKGIDFDSLHVRV